MSSKNRSSQAWQHIPLIPVCERQRLVNLSEAREFQARQGHIMRKCQEKEKEKEEKLKNKGASPRKSEEREKIEIILFQWSKNFNDVSFV